MRIDFRHGIVSHQINGAVGFLAKNGNNVSLLANDRPVLVTIAHKDTDYLHSEDRTVLNAWIAPSGGFLPSKKYWLYWDFDPVTFERSFGYTTIEPYFGPTPSSSITDSDGIPLFVAGRIWFDTTSHTTRELVIPASMKWKEVIRVFAGVLVNNSYFLSMGTNNAPDFTGTQIGDNTAVYAGRVLFAENGKPIERQDGTIARVDGTFKRINGTFFTTEDQFFASASRVDSIRLESNVAIAMCNESNMAAYSVVAWTGDGKVNAAQYDHVGTTVVGILTQDLQYGEAGGIIIQGKVQNANWDWLTKVHSTNGEPVRVGEPLWVSNGQLVYDDPHITNAITYPTARVPVARILSTDTVIFEQGLGGKGEQGPAGDFSIPASTTVAGIAKLSVAPATTDDPIVVGTNDPRLLPSFAHDPTPHTHTATSVSYNPTPNISATNVQNALAQADARLVPSGGTTGQALIKASNSDYDLEWSSEVGQGTVTSVAVSGGTTGLAVTGSPVTTSGTITLSGTLSIAHGGTGQTTASDALNALLPPQAGNNGHVLTTNGNTASWAAIPSGSVTSVAATGSTGLTVIGSPVTTSGTLTFTLSDELQGLSDLSTNGIVRRTGEGTYTASALSSDDITTALGYTPATSNATLTALASYDTNGILTQTATNTFTGRTITGTNSISVTNGNGVSGNPTIQLTNDAAAPGNNRYYGTNSSGTKGFFALPDAEPGGTDGQIQFNNAGVFGGIADGTAGQVLTFNGPGVAPTWQTVVVDATLPQNIQNNNYTFVLSDNGKHIYHTSGSAHSYAIPTNASVAYPIGAVITIVNGSTAGDITITTTGVTLHQAGTSNTGNRTVVANGLVTLLKVGTDTWYINGSGIL